MDPSVAHLGQQLAAHPLRSAAVRAELANLLEKVPDVRLAEYLADEGTEKTRAWAQRILEELD